MHGEHQLVRQGNNKNRVDYGKNPADVNQQQEPTFKTLCD